MTTRCLVEGFPTTASVSITISPNTVTASANILANPCGGRIKPPSPGSLLTFHAAGQAAKLEVTNVTVTYSMSGDFIVIDAEPRLLRLLNLPVFLPMMGTDTSQLILQTLLSGSVKYIDPTQLIAEIAREAGSSSSLAQVLRKIVDNLFGGVLSPAEISNMFDFSELEDIPADPILLVPYMHQLSQMLGGNLSAGSVLNAIANRFAVSFRMSLDGQGNVKYKAHSIFKELKKYLDLRSKNISTLPKLPASSSTNTSVRTGRQRLLLGVVYFDSQNGITDNRAYVVTSDGVRVYKPQQFQKLAHDQIREALRNGAVPIIERINLDEIINLLVYANVYGDAKQTLNAILPNENAFRKAAALILAGKYYAAISSGATYSFGGAGAFPDAGSMISSQDGVNFITTISFSCDNAGSESRSVTTSKSIETIFPLSFIESLKDFTMF